MEEGSSYQNLVDTSEQDYEYLKKNKKLDY